MHLLKIKDIRNLIVRGLRTTTGYTAIVSEQEGPKPPYPYTALKFTLLGETVGQGAQYMQGTKQVNEDDIELVLSVTCYSDTLDGASDLAYSALQHFKVTGVLSLQDNNIAIIDTTAVTDRTTFLTTDWEYRAGFDIRLRVRTRVISDVEYIDTATINIDFE